MQEQLLADEDISSCPKSVNGILARPSNQLEPRPRSPEQLEGLPTDLETGSRGLNDGTGAAGSEQWPTPGRPSAPKRRVVTNTMTHGTAQGVALVASFVFLPLLTRGFGISGYGLYMLALTVASYAYLLDFGVGATLQKRVAEVDAKGDRAGLANLISSALLFYIAVGVVAALGILALALAGRVVFSISDSQAALLRNLLFVAALQSLFSWPLSTATHVLAGLQRHTLLAATSLLATTLQIIGMALVLVAHQGPLVMMCAVALVSIGTSAINGWFARKELPRIEVSPRNASKVGLLGIMRLSWVMFVSQICAFVIYQQTDRIVLASFVGAAAVGLYEAAGKFQGLLVQLAGFANTAVMPAASSLDAQGRNDMIATLYIRGTKYVLALMLPTTLALIIFAKPLIAHWLGLRFLGIVLPAQLIVSHQLLTAGTTVGGNIGIAKGALRERLPFFIALAAENLCISLLLVRPLGILGVVLGTIVPFYLDFPFALRFGLRHARVSIRQWFRDVALPTYTVLPLALVLGSLLARTALTESLVGTLLAGALTVVPYWIAFVALGLKQSERADLRRGALFMWRKIGGASGAGDA
jgi:O-antigen/teichoic acid export membrane protein